MKRRLSAPFFLAFILAGCASSSKLAQNKPSQDRKVASCTQAADILLTHDVSMLKVAHLSEEQVKADITTLEFALERAYGGLNILPDAQYASLLGGLHGLQRQGGTSSDALCDAIGSLVEAIDDFHTSVHIESRTCVRRWPSPAVGANSGVNAKNKTWSYSEYGAQKVPVLSLRRMSPDSSPDWSGFLPELRTLIENRSRFIIDLRGNGGGSMNNVLAMARLMYGLADDKEVPSPLKEVDKRQTAEAWALVANYFWLEMEKYRTSSNPAPSYLSRGYENLQKLYNNSKAGLIPPMFVQKLGTEDIDLNRAVQVPIYVLIDRGCGSSCELLLEALERLPQAITIGENTTGVVQYGEVGYLFLPESHIVVHIPTQGSHYGDNRKIEKIGYQPRFRVPPGSDALDFTIQKFFE